MKSIKITVTDCLASATETLSVVSGTVGLSVEFSFDEVWAGLHKTAVFRANGKCIDVLDISEETTVPWELLQSPGCRLWAGVYGTNPDGSLQIPTVWADLGVIQPGADPSGDESTDPTLPVWEQAREGTVLYTPQEKTENEKSQACKNIGAIKKAADGSLDMEDSGIRNLANGNSDSDAVTVGQLKTTIQSNLWIVTLSDSGRVASKSSGQIYEHVQKGGMVLLDTRGVDAEKGVMYNLCRSTPDLAEFALFGDDYIVETYSINDRAIVEVKDLQVVSKGSFDKTVGDIETALDNIIAIQESLLGGGAE